MHSKSKARQNSLKQLRRFYMQNLESRKKVMVKKKMYQRQADVKYGRERAQKILRST